MQTSQERPIRATGGCLCGSVRYTIRGAVRDVWACHCILCRRLHSHFGAYAACDPADPVSYTHLTLPTNREV